MCVCVCALGLEETASTTRTKASEFASLSEKKKCTNNQTMKEEKQNIDFILVQEMQVKFIRSKQSVRTEEENKALGLEKVAPDVAKGKEKEGLLWLKSMINTSVYT